MGKEDADEDIVLMCNRKLVGVGWGWGGDGVGMGGHQGEGTEAGGEMGVGVGGGQAKERGERGKKWEGKQESERERENDSLDIFPLVFLCDLDVIATWFQLILMYLSKRVVLYRESVVQNILNVVLPVINRRKKNISGTGICLTNHAHWLFCTHRSICLTNHAHWLFCT